MKFLIGVIVGLCFAPGSFGQQLPVKAFGESYLMDFAFSRFKGIATDQKSCLFNVREGQELLRIYQNPAGPYKKVFVPEGVLIDSLLKQKALVFVFDIVLPFEGQGGMMTPGEQISVEGVSDADFIRSSNRMIFGILPNVADPEKAIVVIKGPGTCGFGTYKTLPKVHIKIEESEATLEVTCGKEFGPSSAETNYSLSFERTNKGVLRPRSFKIRADLAESQPSSDGVFTQYRRAARDKKRIIDLECENLTEFKQ